MEGCGSGPRPHSPNGSGVTPSRSYGRKLPTHKRCAACRAGLRPSAFRPGFFGHSASGTRPASLCLRGCVRFGPGRPPPVTALPAPAGASSARWAVPSLCCGLAPLCLAALCFGFALGSLRAPCSVALAALVLAFAQRAARPFLSPGPFGLRGLPRRFASRRRLLPGGRWRASPAFSGLGRRAFMLACTPAPLLFRWSLRCGCRWVLPCRPPAPAAPAGGSRGA